MIVVAQDEWSPKTDSTVSSYRYDTESKIRYGRPSHCSQLSLVIARGAADDLNIQRGCLGAKHVISMCSFAEQFSLFEIR